jgi:hypothetical protein
LANAHYDVFLSKTLERLLIVWLSHRIQLDMQKPLIHRDILEYAKQDARRQSAISEGFSSGSQLAALE